MSMFKTAIGGAAWTTCSTVVRSLVSLLQISVLTRFLDKSDFGIVAIATLFIGFTTIFLDLGISIGILHKQNISRNEYSSLFWLNIITGLFLTLLLIIIAPLVSLFYGEHELKFIIQLLCLNLLFASIGNQHRIVQQKKMRFRIISIVEILSSLLSLLFVFYLAYNDFGIYSLVYSSLLGTIVPNIIFLIIGILLDGNLYLHFSMKETYPFLKIGGFNVAGATIDYFSREIDIMIISMTLGLDALGIYSLCKKLVTSLYASIVPIYNNVLVPMLAKIQDDLEKTRNVIYDVIEAASLSNYPLFILVAVFSGFIIFVLYGDRYMDGYLLLSVLAIHFGYMTPFSPASCVQVAYGRTDLGFYWTLCRILLWALFSYVGAQFSIEIMTIALLIGGFVSTPIFWRITIYPIIGGSFFDYYKKSIYPLLLSLSLGVPFFLFFHNCLNFGVVILAGSLYLIIYSLLVFKCYRKCYIVEKIESFTKHNYYKTFHKDEEC